jgi:hypothetical protein
VGGGLKDRGTDGIRKCTGEIKIRKKFQFETVKGKGNFGVQGLDEML